MVRVYEHFYFPVVEGFGRFCADEYAVVLTIFWVVRSYKYFFYPVFEDFDWPSADEYAAACLQLLSAIRAQ